MNSEEIILDNAQIQALDQLNRLKKLSSKNSVLFNFLNIFKKNQNNPSSIYIYGQVGRGKSMLMARFFNSLQIEDKLYFHFNSFMQKIHRELYELRKNPNRSQDDIIEIATKNIIGNNKIICLDEFQVEDVTDALILRKIFSYIFANQILVVFTSNSHPKNLYKNGLQRDSFIKFVDEILLKNCQVINLDSGIDYRCQYLQSVKKHYFYPINAKNKNEINEIFSKITENSELQSIEIKILGRKLLIKNSYKNVAMFDFKELFNENLGVVDYQAICKKFDVIFLLNIPQLTKEDVNEARRLILFIDEIYENKVALLMLSQVAIDKIYSDGIGSEAFKRTVSRLNEIISDHYWQRSKYILQ